MNSANLDALIDRAHAAWEAGDLFTARALFAEVVAAGDVRELLNLGYFFDEGLGGPCSPSTAQRLYRRAAKLQAHRDSAATNLALLFRAQGRLAWAWRWFRRAHQPFDADTWLNLARCYATGCGVRQSTRLSRAAARHALRSRVGTQAARMDALRIIKLRAKAYPRGFNVHKARWGELP
jgi:TPR repeat protein